MFPKIVSSARKREMVSTEGTEFTFATKVAFANIKGNSVSASNLPAYGVFYTNISFIIYTRIDFILLILLK